MQPAPDPAPAAMSEHCYAEGRRLREAGHAALAEQLLAAGAYWWSIAKAGRTRTWERLDREREEKRA